MGFLEKIRNSDDGTKKIWLILFTSVAMAVLIFVWVAYFNTLLVNINKPLEADEVAKSDEFGFFDTIKSGAATVYEFLADTASGIFGEINKPKEYIIEP